MKRSRKPYPDAFKQEAVRLLTEQRLPCAHVARDLGVDPETLRRGARERASDNRDSHDRATDPRISAAERARLRRENQQLRMERAILKKAIGIFSRMPPCARHINSWTAKRARRQCPSFAGSWRWPVLAPTLGGSSARAHVPSATSC